MDSITCTPHCAAEGKICCTAQADELTICRDALQCQAGAPEHAIQLIQFTLAQAESAQGETSVSRTPAQSLRRLFDKASLEPGRVVGVGGAYYGAR